MTTTTNQLITEPSLITNASPSAGQSQSQAMGLLTSSTTPEWYTPRRYVKAALLALGGFISLDPASSHVANERIVQADCYFTQEDDPPALERNWHGTVFCNPPYGKNRATGESWQGLFAQKLIHEFANDRVQAGIILVNLYAGYRWFQQLSTFARCEVDHLIKFVNPAVPDDLERGEGTKPAKASSVIFYIGDDDDLFYKHFSQFGNCGRLR